MLGLVVCGLFVVSSRVKTTGKKKMERMPDKKFTSMGMGASRWYIFCIMDRSYHILYILHRSLIRTTFICTTPY